MLSACVVPAARTRAILHSAWTRLLLVLNGSPTINYRQVTAVHEVMHTMKTNLANIKNVLGAWDRPLMERKPKPVDRDEFERAHKAIKSSRYAEIKEGGKVTNRLLDTVRYSTMFPFSVRDENDTAISAPPR